MCSLSWNLSLVVVRQKHSVEFLIAKWAVKNQLFIQGFLFDMARETYLTLAGLATGLTLLSCVLINIIRGHGTSRPVHGIGALASLGRWLLTILFLLGIFHSTSLPLSWNGSSPSFFYLAYSIPLACLFPEMTLLNLVKDNLKSSFVVVWE